MVTTVRFASRLGTLLLAAMMLTAFCATAKAQVPEVSLPSGYRGGYLVFRSADSAFEYTLDGRVQIDAAFYRGGTNRLGSGTDVRRARLGWKATMFRDWHGEIDVDFADNAVEMKDAWIGYIGFRNTLVRAGQFREPFSLETITSSKYITFMERSYIDNMSPDRRMGLGAATHGNWWFVAGGVFGQEAGTADESGRGEAHAYVGRAVVAPINEDGKLFHIGGAIERRTPDAAIGADTNTVRFRARPESWISKTRFISTGKIRSIDYTQSYNAEMTSTYGPLTLQGEYTRVGIYRLGVLPHIEVDGGYAMASWFITGEHRPYLMSEAEYDRVIPNSPKIGAWEVAARWSTLDLNDPRPDINLRGGRATNYTFGLNWHINPNFKWMLNYVHVLNDDNAKADLGIAPLLNGGSFTIIQTRFALAF
jgi:phosphate-selective porin OprO/OprP